MVENIYKRAQTEPPVPFDEKEIERDNRDDLETEMRLDETSEQINKIYDDEFPDFVDNYEL